MQFEPGQKVPRRRDTQATRQALLDAGTALFAERGYAETTVETIARTAGVNKAMINYHFGGKRGLLMAIVIGVIDPARQRLAAIAAGGEPADARLRAFVRVFGELAEAHPAFPALMLREMVAGGRHLEPPVFARVAAVFQLVQGIVDQGIREGRFRAVDPLLTHLSLIGALIFFFATAPARERLLEQGLLSPPAPAGEDFVRHLQDLLSHGLAAP